MSYVAALSAIILFALAFRVSGIFSVARDSFVRLDDALRTIRSEGLSIDEKEERVQTASIQLFVCFLSILVRGALVLTVSYVPIAALDALGFAPTGKTLECLMSWEFVIGGFVAFILLNVGLRRPGAEASVRRSRD